MERQNIYNVKKQIKYSILIFLFGAIPMGFLMCPQCYRSIANALPVAMYSGLMWFFLWKGNEYIYMLTDRYVSWYKTPIKRMFIGLGLMIGYTSFIVIMLTFTFFVFVFNQEIDDKLFAELKETVIFSITISTIIMLFFTAKGFLLAWRQSAINIEKIQREHISSQYETLKNQVNPHFLFNSLNALSSLVYDNPDKAVEFINRLSDVYRYVLDSKDKEVVPITEELTFIRSYIFLLKARFENNLIMEISIDGQVGYIPPMALQMLIENAVKHNEISDAHPLTVSVFQDDQYIFVKNNVHLKIQESDTPGIGLANIKSRYSILSDLPVKLVQSEGLFSVGLPILQIV